MRYLKVLMLSLLAGQAHTATTTITYDSAVIYGKPNEAGILDSIQGGPLLQGSGQMTRFGDCLKRNCQILFTDVTTIRSLHKEKVKTTVGGLKGFVDGLAKVRFVEEDEDMSGSESGSEDEHEVHSRDGHRSDSEHESGGEARGYRFRGRISGDISGSESESGSEGRRRAMRELRAVMRSDADGYGSGSESESESVHGSDHGHEMHHTSPSASPRSHHDAAFDFEMERELDGSDHCHGMHHIAHHLDGSDHCHGMHHIAHHDSESGSESECESNHGSDHGHGHGMHHKALFNNLTGITCLGSTVVVADKNDKGVGFLRMVSPFLDHSVQPPALNHTVETFRDLRLTEPHHITSDGKGRVYCTDKNRIVEVDFTQEPPMITTVAGIDSNGGLDNHRLLEKELRGSSREAHRTVRALMREIGAGSDSDDGHESGDDFDRRSNSGSDHESEHGLGHHHHVHDFDVASEHGSDDHQLSLVPLVTEINNPYGIAYAEKVGIPTLYVTQQNRVIELKQDVSKGQWVPHDVAGSSGVVGDVDATGAAARFSAPKGVSITKEGYLLIADGDKMKMVDPATGVVTTLKKGLDGAVEQVIEGCEEGTLCARRVNCIEKFKKGVTTPPPTTEDPTTGKTAKSNGANNTVKGAVELEAGTEVEEQFRFALSPDQMKLSMRQKGVNFDAENGRDGIYSKALSALEKSLDTTKAIKQIGKGMTFWISGLYSQAQMSEMLGNPAMSEKHYGIIAGTHYKDVETQQTFGVAIDIGLSNSVGKQNKDLKSDSKSAQLTLYYNKMLTKNWKVGVHANFMRSMDRHQRPFIDNTNSQQIAIGNGITHDYSLNAEVSYKHEFSKDNYIKPFVGCDYSYNQQFAYEEKNVGRYNRKYDAANMDQAGLQFGIKSSIGEKISDTKTFVVLPMISYTNFVKMGKMSQKSINVNSGQSSFGKSGTPGRHLLSATLGVGIVDYEANTTTKFSYTGNVQKYKKSHEVMIDWGVKF